MYRRFQNKRTVRAEFADKCINVFLVVAYFAHVIIIFYDKRNRQQSRKVIGMTIWIIPIMTLLYNGMAKLTHMGAETEDLFMALIMEQAYCLLL